MSNTIDSWLEAQRINNGSHGFECIGIARMQQVWEAAQKELRQQLAEACGLLGGSSEWIRFGSTQERYLYAKIQKFILDNQ